MAPGNSTFGWDMKDDWHSYPFQLVPGDPQLGFPAAEGDHPDQESDTWFIAGQLEAPQTERSFAFLTIFNRNRPGGSIVADFYTLALFDLDTGEYGTYTDYDMPPASMEPGARPKLTADVGSLGLEYQSGAGAATWTTCRDDAGELLPYTYRISLVGTDQSGAAMRLDLDVAATRAPTPLGASDYNGRIICFGQDDTYSYFQTGMSMTGTLRWGDVDEHVSGSAGHVDRQWFPKYAGGGTGEPPRTRSHEWRTINFDNGVDMSIWRQFHRAEGNALQPFTAITTSYPDSAQHPDCAEDLDITIDSYVRWPEAIRPLIRPPARGRYLPDRHRITSATLQLDIVGEPLVAAPAHGLPIEYMEGPYRYSGTLAGEPVTAFAFNERSLALYRDWELVEVLATNAAHAADAELNACAEQVGALLISGRRADAVRLLSTTRPGRPESVATLLDDLIAALSAD